VVSAAAVIIVRSARACARPSVRAPPSVAATGAASGRKPTELDAPAPVSGAVLLGRVVRMASVELKVIAGGCDEDTPDIP